MKRTCPYCNEEQDVVPDVSLVFTTEQECEVCGEMFAYQTTAQEAREIEADSLYDLAEDA